jgi:hypothetical protein
VRCSKPVVRGTAAEIGGQPVHLRCVVRDAQLAAIEQQDRAGYELLRAQVAQARAAELIEVVRLRQRMCPACGQRLGTSRGVLFQGDQLVHAPCWRDSEKPPDPSADPV